LAGSIRAQGVIEPIVVRQLGDRYELIVGERRWRAARLAGLETVPALVKELLPRQSLEIALVENVQRQDLNPIELALAFHTLAEGGATQEAIGERVALDRSTVANHLRLLDLSRDMQEDLELGRLTMGHAKALLQVANPERRRHLRDRVVQRGLSVRESEELARALAGARASKRTARPADPTLAPLVDALRERLKTRVRVRGRAVRGRIEIEFHGAEALDRIAGLILGS
jgi:ParB family chromosome partitioning protein